LFSRSSGVVLVCALSLPLILAGGERTERERVVARAGKNGRTPVRMAHWASPVASLSSNSVAQQALASSLAGALNFRSRGGRWGVLVTSISRGDTLFASEPDRMLKPASTMKLLTTALAFERFGREHTFATEALSNEPVRAGVVAGDLYLRGGGDPTLANRFAPRGQSPMDALARRIKAAGVQRIRGDIVADETAFAPERIPQGWKRSYQASAYAAPVSALSLNENVVWVDTRVVGDSAVVTIDPPSAMMTVTNRVRVIEGRGGRVLVGRTKTGVLAAGTIGIRSNPRRYSLVVLDPPSFAAGALASSLAREGIVVDGSVRAGVAPNNAHRIAQVQSLPLDSIVGYMNRESNNHAAELLYRSAAREDGRAGSAETALETLRGFLSTRAGVSPEAIRVRDGSGLSEADTLTARSLVQVLSYAHRAPWSSAYHTSLPVAGQNEGLKRRMRATLAHGNLHAKTGSTNTVASLAGYVTSRNGELLAFAFIYNGRDIWNARQAMDRMGSSLASFSRDLN
jgi:D-alanyl-D-alanine carboxypeptidase/D-alanyl-D-alanine-endopeptidase (penicillin-binding protein 4)